MLAIEHNHYPASPGVRAEVVDSVMGACDLCGKRCEASREFDGNTHWSQATAHLKAVSAGYIERMRGRVQQLVCPECQYGITQ
jgi:uncharacterized Fe-S radical SAM superfamily protein PflX